MRIDIRGIIVSNDTKWIYDYFDMEATCPKEVSSVIDEAKGEALEVIINSPGGDVFAGSEIYTSLMDYEGEITVKIVGIAASAASIIAMAGTKVLMSPTAEMMIHNVSSYVEGDYRDMEHEAEVLKDYNSTIANAYMIKSGLAKEQLLGLMNKETWLTPERALELKLIDEIMFMENALKLSASLGQRSILPPEVINKMRNTLKQLNTEDKENPPKEADFLMQENKVLAMELSRTILNYLKLKGAVKDG